MESTATIPESFYEHRQLFTEPWVDKWVIPNPFIAALLVPLQAIGVELADFSFNKDAANLAETYLNIAIRRLNAAVRIGLESVTFIAANPDWVRAPDLVKAFDGVSEQIRKVTHAVPKSQEATLAFHVTPGTGDFGTITAALVNEKLGNGCLFCGVSLHRADSALIIDKSIKYEGAAFVRLQRSFSGDATFSLVASQLYEDEVSALGLIGIAGIP